MAGHSHSANIARRKGAVDAKRGKHFSKYSRAIISAARQGGGDPDANLKLKYAIENAKAGNMPKDTIERAIARGSGSKDGDDWQEIIYEGYAQAGVALMVACLTDNRSRTAPDIRHLFEKGGGSIGAPGSVAFQFQLRSQFVLERAERNEDQLTELALEVGADDVEIEGDTALLIAPANGFLAMKAQLEKGGNKFASAELAWVPQTRVAIADKEVARKVLKLIELLEDNEDVQNVYANYDIPSEWLDELA